MRAMRKGTKVHLFIEDEKIGAFDIQTKVLGLAMQGGTVAFRDVKWE